MRIYAVHGYLSELVGIENQLLVRLRADLADSDLPIGEVIPALCSDTVFRNRFDAMVTHVVPLLDKDLKVTAGREVASFVGSEIATVITVRVGAAVMTRLGVSAGVVSAGAASSWATLGLGLVAGYDAEERVAARVDEMLDDLGHMMVDGDPEAATTLEQLKRMQTDDPDQEVRTECTPERRRSEQCTNWRLTMKPLVVVLVLVILALTARPVFADLKAKAAQELAEYVLERFGREAAKDGPQALARRIEQSALRHGDDVFKVVRELGPRGLRLIEEAGGLSNPVASLLARYGEPGAVWVVSRPRGMAIFLRHGEEAARVLVKHQGIAEPLVDQLGVPAVSALQAVGTRNARKLGMTAERELAQIGRTPELLQVIGSYGDRAMDFVWKQKASLATAAVLAAFLANPEPFITGAKDFSELIAQNAVKPVVEIPAKIAMKSVSRINWTLILLVVIGMGTLYLGVRMRAKGRSGTASPAKEQPS